MWIFSIVISWVADWMISSERFNHTYTRKIVNSIGQYGPAVCLVAASYTGCDRITTVALLTLGVGLNGGIYSGFKINHLDITPRFAGILMALTNCTANLAGLLAPITAGILIDGKVKHHNIHPIRFNNFLLLQPTIAAWRNVFFISAAVYVFCATFYNIFGSGKRQKWDNPDNDEPSRAITQIVTPETTSPDIQLSHRPNGVRNGGTTVENRN